MCQVAEEEGYAHEGIAAIMGCWVDDTAVAFAADDGVGLLHLGHHIHLAHSSSVVLLAILAGYVAQGTGGREVADGIAWGMLEDVVSHRDKGVLFAIHLAVFADKGETVHIRIHHEPHVVAALSHQSHDVGEVLFEGLRIVLKVTCGLCVEWGDLFHTQCLEEFRQDDAAHGVDAVESYLEVLLLDGGNVHKVETQHHVYMFLVIGVVFEVFAQSVNVGEVKVFCLSNLQNFVAFVGIEEFALLVEELEGVPMAGVMMMPPQAPSMATAISVVGVEARPMLTTSKPIPMRVPQTTFLTISPEMRASRPTTILLLCTLVVRRISVAYALVNFTMSRGFRPSPARPPMVPRMPEMDLMRLIYMLY